MQREWQVGAPTILNIHTSRTARSTINQSMPAYTRSGIIAAEEILGALEASDQRDHPSWSKRMPVTPQRRPFLASRSPSCRSIWRQTTTLLAKLIASATVAQSNREHSRGLGPDHQSENDGR